MQTNDIDELSFDDLVRESTQCEGYFISQFLFSLITFSINWIIGKNTFASLKFA